MTKTELEFVNPSNPKFYKRFADDIINRRNKSQPDDLFQKLNSNHPNMKCTVEVKPEFFLDTKIGYSNDVITTEVKRNERKLPVDLLPKLPKQYKRNAIISDLRWVTTKKKNEEKLKNSQNLFYNFFNSAVLWDEDTKRIFTKFCFCFKHFS